MVARKRFCFFDGDAIRAKAGAGRIGDTAKSGRQSGRAPAGNPSGRV